MRERIATVLEVAGLVAVSAAAGLGAGDIAGPAAGCAAGGLALVLSAQVPSLIERLR